MAASGAKECISLFAVLHVASLLVNCRSEFCCVSCCCVALFVVFVFALFVFLMASIL